MNRYVREMTYARKQPTVSITGDGAGLGSNVYEFGERHTRSAFRRYARRIAQIAIRLTDVNGVRGGIDKECRIQMRLVPKGRLVARARDANVYAALTLAVERAVRLLDCKLKRRRSMTRFRMEELR